MAIKDVKRKDVINEWLGFGVVFWGVENLSKHLLGQPQMWLTIKRRVKRQQRPTVLQTVASKLKFFGCVNVLDLELDGGAVGALGQPQEQVHMLVTIEIQVVVAASLKTQIVDDLPRVFALKLRLLL